MTVLRFPLAEPMCDFAAMERVIRGEGKPRRVHFMDSGVADQEIEKIIIEKHLKKKWIPPQQPAYLAQQVDLTWRMGFDCIKAYVGFHGLPYGYVTKPAEDTAEMSRGQCAWLDDAAHRIHDWSSFRKVDWKHVRPNLELLDRLAELLPPGMKIAVWYGFYAIATESLISYEDLCYLSHDDPDLVRALFDAFGEKVHELYAQAIRHPAVGAIFHADDMGHKTGLLMPADWMREHIFPWMKRYTELAHVQGKTFWLHCCGNALEVMDDLIDDVKIDAFHSFQDVIIPVTEFHRRYGDRIAAIGGVDVDAMVRLSPDDLRSYVWHILDECMPRGRYVFGSGNSVPNYVPPENYMVYMQAALDWTNTRLQNFRR